MIDVAVDAVFVDVLGKQFADDEIDFGATAVVEESARIRHHATVDGNGEMLVEFVEVS